MPNHAKDRAKAIEWARKVYTDDLVIVDAETTGLSSTDEVVQLGVVGVHGGQPLVLLDALVRPIRATMHPKATAASGITDAMLQYGAFDGEWNDYYGNYRWYKLTEACRSMGVPVKDAHVASGDCLMTFQLIKKMAESES